MMNMIACKTSVACVWKNKKCNTFQLATHCYTHAHTLALIALLQQVELCLQDSGLLAHLLESAL